MYPARDTLQHAGSKNGGKWRDRRREKHCQFSLSSSDVLMFRLRKHQDSRENKTNCFPKRTGSDIKRIMLNSINIFRHKKPILIVLKTFLFNDFYRLVSEIDIKRMGEKRCFLKFERSRGKKRQCTIYSVHVTSVTGALRESFSK